MDTTIRESKLSERLANAIRQTAPGTALRTALDMIIAGNLGALICIGDTENVLAAGNDGFKLDISFTANRLFELSKMDGAIVVDKDLTQILRANYHLNPDPTLPTSETGMRHRTAARMSLLTRAIVISVSERRQVITLYVDGRGHQIRTVPVLMASVNQLLVSMQNTRQQLDRSLLRLTTLELDNYVTLEDVADTLYLFEVLMTEAEGLDRLILQLGVEGRTVRMQRDEFIGDMDDKYTLMIRDYAADSSVESAQAIRRALHQLDARLRRDARELVVQPYGRFQQAQPLLREVFGGKAVDQLLPEQQVRAEFRVVHRDGVDKGAVPAHLLEAPDVVKQTQEPREGDAVAVHAETDGDAFAVRGDAAGVLHLVPDHAVIQIVP